MQRNRNKASYSRFIVSFGAWNELLELLGHLEFLLLQALNRYAYKTGIRRCMVSWKLGGSLFFLTCSGFNHKSTVAFTMQKDIQTSE